MAEQLSRDAEAFAAGVTARRENLGVRAAVALAGVFVFEPIVGLQFGALWALAYLAAQLIDGWAFDPISRNGQMTAPKWRMAIGCAGMLLNTSLYAALSVPL